jgi:hypothetical protein
MRACLVAVLCSGAEIRLAAGVTHSLSFAIEKSGRRDKRRINCACPKNVFHISQYYKDGVAQERRLEFLPLPTAAQKCFALRLEFL